MKLDRELQRRILQDMCNIYPDLCTKAPTDWDPDEDKTIANLAYLDAHGLIKFHADRSMSGGWLISGYEATHKGMDFMANDGGLTAILGVVTVKLHDDTIKDLVALRIQDMDLEPAEKKRWIDALRELPGEATKHLAMKLLDLGLEKAPSAIEVVKTTLGF